MKMLKRQPTEGQFVAVWKLTNGTVWSESYLIKDDMLHAYNSVTDEWDADCSSYHDVGKKLLESVQFVVAK